MREKGLDISPRNLRLADNAALILPSHGALDRAREERRGDKKIGTTGRGIGPAYEDKVGRRAIRVCDLADRKALEGGSTRCCCTTTRCCAGSTSREVERAELLAALARGRAAHPALCRPVLAPARRREAPGAGASCSKGAQGAMLDVDHGTYPLRHLVEHAGRTGGGRGGHRAGGDRLRARHHQGLYDAGRQRAVPDRAQRRDRRELLGERGREFGVVTGRKRRCGWFDAVAVRQAVKTGGIDGIALTKLDVLDGFDEVKFCTAYRRGGETYDYVPAGMTAQADTRAGLRDRRGVARKHPRRTLVGRFAGDRDQIHRAARGADRRAGRAAIDEPRARGHGAGARSLRRLIRSRAGPRLYRPPRACGATGVLPERACSPI